MTLPSQIAFSIGEDLDSIASRSFLHQTEGEGVDGDAPGPTSVAIWRNRSFDTGLARAVEGAAPPRLATDPDPEEIWTTRPHPCSTIAGSSACIMCNEPKMLMSMYGFHSCRGVSRNGNI